MVENYQIYIGLANLLSNCDRFDEALAKYQKVITLKPALLSSYVSIAFIR
jgi:tetratricopeptide (TPR) repeat protein